MKTKYLEATKFLKSQTGFEVLYDSVGAITEESPSTGLRSSSLPPSPLFFPSPQTP